MGRGADAPRDPDRVTAATAIERLAGSNLLTKYRERIRENAYRPTGDLALYLGITQIYTSAIGFRMNGLMPFMCVNEACDQVLPLVCEQLQRAGFRVVQTFDLQAARLAHPDGPQQGVDDCSCQMVVLLVYGAHSTPATLVIHGQDARSWLSLASPAGQRADPHMESTIRRALTPRPSDVSSMEVVYDGRSPS